MIIFDTLSITYTEPKIITGRFIDVEYELNEKGETESIVLKATEIQEFKSDSEIKGTDSWKTEVEKSKPQKI